MLDVWLSWVGIKIIGPINDKHNAEYIVNGPWKLLHDTNQTCFSCITYNIVYSVIVTFNTSYVELRTFSKWRPLVHL